MHFGGLLAASQKLLLEPVHLFALVLEAGLELSDGPLGLSEVVLQRPRLLIVGPEQGRQLPFLPNQPDQGLVLPLQQPVEDSVLFSQFLQAGGKSCSFNLSLN